MQCCGCCIGGWVGKEEEDLRFARWCGRGDRGQSRGTATAHPPPSSSTHPATHPPTLATYSLHAGVGEEVEDGQEVLQRLIRLSLGMHLLLPIRIIKGEGFRSKGVPGRGERRVGRGASQHGGGGGWTRSLGRLGGWVGGTREGVVPVVVDSRDDQAERTDQALVNVERAVLVERTVQVFPCFWVWVGGWVGWVQEEEAVGMRCWGSWVGGWVG